MRIQMLAFTFVAALALTAPAQLVNGIVNPPIQSPGQSVSVLLTNVSGSQLDLPSGCVIDEVRIGSPMGPVVWSPFCLGVIAPWPAGGTLTGVWPGTDSLGAPVLPGVYFMRVQYYTAGFGSLRKDWFPVDMRSNAPVLAAAGQPTRGLPFTMTVSAPQYPGAGYVAAFATTTNAGQSFGSFFIHLDADPIFELSTFFGLLPPFVGMQGTLDATGSAGGIGLLQVPNVPSLGGARLHAQAVVLAPAGIVETNSLSFAVQ